MPNFWMVRAGEGGYLFSEFENHNCVAIGWHQDFTDARTLEEVKRKLAQDPETSKGALANAAAMVFKFRSVMDPGDKVVTYDPKTRDTCWARSRVNMPLTRAASPFTATSDQ